MKMQIVSLGDNLHEMASCFLGKIRKHISKCHLLKILSRMLSIKQLFLKILSGKANSVH